MDPLEAIIRTNCPPLEPIPTDVSPELNRLSGMKAVLFDVYGTLFVSGSGDVGTASATDTSEALTQALTAAGFEGDLEQAGEIGKNMLKSAILEWHGNSRANGIDYPEVDIIQIWEKVVDGLCKTEMLEHLTAHGGTASSLSADAGREPSLGQRPSRGEGIPPPGPDVIRQLALEYECRVNPVFPMPGSRETIHLLKEQGLVLGIVSNAQFYTPLLFTAFFDQSVANAGFDPDCCIWSFKELTAKPSDALFPKAGRFLRKKHNIGLEETVYVGNDMLNDVYCANKAGCKTILFAGDQRSLRLRENEERCLAIKPDAVITSLAQLPGIIE